MSKRSILMIVQAYWPDTVSSAQHVTDLCEALARDGASVTVICSGRMYESGDLICESAERRGVTIKRVNHAQFDRGSLLARALNIVSFNLSLCLQLIRDRGLYSHVLSLTSPPFSGILGALKARLVKAKFIFWGMDLQPELSIAAGVMAEGSLQARFFRAINKKTFSEASKIIALDRFMSAYLASSAVTAEQVVTIPVWTVTDKIYEGSRERNPFRLESEFGDKLVIMYSGNHAFVHPLDTLLEAAVEMQHNPRVHFAFVGGGVRVADVSRAKNNHRLLSLSQHPFQPRVGI